MPVFISHSGKDQAIYSELSLALDEEKIPHWDVSSLTAGLSLAEQLRNAITQCEVCIFLASRRSIQSPWCLAELGAFWGTGKPVVVYRVDPEVTEHELPPQFHGNLWATNVTQVLQAVSKDIRNAASTDLSQIQGEYHTRDSRNYIVKLTCISGGIYTVSNPDWHGLGYFNGRLYVGFYQYKSTRNEPAPSTWGGALGLHRARLDRRNGALSLKGIEVGNEGKEVKSFSGAWLRVNEDGE